MLFYFILFIYGTKFSQIADQKIDLDLFILANRESQNNI